ncbi:serine/threonine-protein phosphatase 7 long form-like protein [Hibiscus syriacus]|uniref:Serine/threonine-protein phosphatase 7 long form-like protein n=1 Tax=Hibiscus syriacus TaxID=106335 RepID=A0A6A2ZE74_HIBSY|nr:sarcoplasmic reticulum histidine-rich calcium-binding protein-like [Hibiscus syriacus]XP_039016183.1 sarcoplasmic reticulum histidine-rich calcium-binding protein-like [Hibiscus syriacus]XP_039016201.1 sarcoplasmic reticulum histidine-rich calcium-binding protein-like [Hibiscus syriacus]KAE8689896.1 serine/threonine-protein phosphatase 7 long form-like protein [Hibiscus syriacus]KAE8689899.1 serine/threonine-protein phosphatase 7 long form-like protein [Hibiscus syriacus]
MKRSSMEIEGAYGSKLALKPGLKTIFGRGLGFNNGDRTVSRRHVELELETPVDKTGGTQNDPMVSFEVIGKNPVWVRSRTNGEIKVYKSSDKGQLENGDWFCVSGRIPVWFVVKKIEENEKQEEDRDLGSGSGAESVDVEHIDPVKEFGFLVIGHEFDQYPNQRIPNIKNWDWFLEERVKGSDHEDDEDEAFDGRRKSQGRKRKEGENADDDWTGESEGDIEEVALTGRKVRRGNYSTRSKDRDKSKKDGGKRRNYAPTKSVAAGEEGGVDDDDETLGGFIVEDDDAEVEEESELDEEEEDDFDDEEEDNEDDN